MATVTSPGSRDLPSLTSSRLGSASATQISWDGLMYTPMFCADSAVSAAPDIGLTGICGDCVYLNGTTSDDACKKW
jgi:hypothetical protein